MRFGRTSPMTASVAVAAVVGMGIWSTVPQSSEPYPAINLPSFAGSPLQNGIVSVTRPVVTVEFADGSQDSVPYAALLPANSPNPVNVFRSLAGAEETATQPETLAWFRDVLAARYPAKTVASLTIEWIRTKYRAHDQAVRDIEVLESFRLDLTGPL